MPASTSACARSRDFDKISIGGAPCPTRPAWSAPSCSADWVSYATDSDDFEVTVGYGKGETSDATRAAVKRVGSFTTYTGEIGWYHQLVGPLQVGAKAGAGYDQVKINGPLGGSFSGKRFGVDLMAEIGWRF